MLQAEKQVGSPPWCRNILQPEHHTHASLTVQMWIAEQGYRIIKCQIWSFDWTGSRAISWATLPARECGVLWNCLNQFAGIPGAWRAVETWKNCVLMLQDTDFTEADLKSFQLAAKKDKLKVYHNSCGYQAGRKVEGFTALIPSKLRQHRLPDTAGNLLTCCIEGIACINTMPLPAAKKASLKLSLRHSLHTNLNMSHGLQTGITMKAPLTAIFIPAEPLMVELC